MDLVNSKRVLLTASYVSVELTPEERHHADAEAGRGLEKLGFIRQLGVSAAEVSRVEESAGRQQNAAVRDGMLAMAALLRQVHAPGDAAGSGLSLAAQAATMPVPAIQAPKYLKISWGGDPAGLRPLAEFDAARYADGSLGAAELRCRYLGRITVQ